MASGHYRLETKIIGRRVKGVDKSVSMVAKAAYRSGQSLQDERADKTFNYRPRAQEVVYSEIMSPANAPGWLKEPSPDMAAGRTARALPDGRLRIGRRVAPAHRGAPGRA